MTDQDGQSYKKEENHLNIISTRQPSTKEKISKSDYALIYFKAFRVSDLFFIFGVWSSLFIISAKEQMMEIKQESDVKVNQSYLFVYTFWYNFVVCFEQ